MCVCMLFLFLTSLCIQCNSSRHMECTNDNHDDDDDVDDAALLLSELQQRLWMKVVKLYDKLTRIKRIESQHKKMPQQKQQYQ